MTKQKYTIEITPSNPESPAYSRVLEASSEAEAKQWARWFYKVEREDQAAPARVEMVRGPGFHAY